MDIGTWNRLRKTEQKEVDSMSSAFIKAVQNSKAYDGFDFMNKYEVKKKNNYYLISEKGTGISLGNFQSKNKAVIEALMTDAAQNYGR